MTRPDGAVTVTTAPRGGPSAEAAMRAQVLTEALPYIQEFRDRIVVVKYGGNALAGAVESPAAALASFASDIALLRSVGLKPVVVHGGGPQIGELMGRLGKQSEFRGGLRVTDRETLDIARMVLVGKVNREIVAAVNVHGPIAVGLSGEDAGLLRAAPEDPALGFVGRVEAVNPDLPLRLVAESLVPVVATIGTDGTGQAYNINADVAAGAVAAALGATKLVYLTDVEGVRADRSDPATLARSLTPEGLDGLVASGAVADGMIPKAASCALAVRAGVGAAHILDGRLPHALLLELFTQEGIGTMVSLS